MLNSYFRTAWRSVTLHKTFSAINIVGLTIGLGAGMLVATVVIDHLSYDKSWSKGENLYRIVSINKMGEGLYDRSPSSFAGLGPALKSNFPEVTAVSGISTGDQRLRLSEQDANGITVRAMFADTCFWQLLDIHVREGNPREFVDGTNKNIIITESFRKRFFGAKDPVGTIIHSVPTFSSKATDYLITGVIDDLPSNSVLRAEVIFVLRPRTEELQPRQYGTLSQNFILLRSGTDPERFADRVNGWYRHQVTVANPYRFAFQRVKDMYLHSDFAGSQSVKGDYKDVLIFSGVAVLLLLIACVNFVNLSTARALQRLRETGLRKILGARRRQLVYQFLAESLVYFFISSLAATAIYVLTTPLLEAFVGHPLTLTFTNSVYLFAPLFVTVLSISLVTGIYPALVLSASHPSTAVKGELLRTRTGSRQTVRKGLVVVQFALSMVVVIALVVVQQQVAYLRNKDIGYNTDHLLSIDEISWDGKGAAFKNELLQQPGVEGASITSWLPTVGAGFMSRVIDHPGRPGEKLTIWYINGDPDLATVMGLHLTKGRLLDERHSADLMSQDSLMRMDSAHYAMASSRQSALLTAYAAKVLGMQQLNTTIRGVNTVPVGIVRDFNNESLKEQLKPTIILAENSPQYGGMLIKVKPGQEARVKSWLAKNWRSFFGDKLLEIRSVDEMLAAQYRSEARLQRLFQFFSGLSLLLSALGVLGLIIHATSARKKEIGIRKVVGASVFSIARLFSVDFLRLVLIALMIASPVAWWLMNRWLADFAYRIDIGVWVFIFTGAIVMLTALAAASVQTIRAARANPVRSLRAE